MMFKRSLKLRCLQFQMFSMDLQLVTALSTSTNSNGTGTYRSTLQGCTRCQWTAHGYWSKWPRAIGYEWVSMRYNEGYNMGNNYQPYVISRFVRNRGTIDSWNCGIQHSKNHHLSPPNLSYPKPLVLEKHQDLRVPAVWTHSTPS